MGIPLFVQGAVLASFGTWKLLHWVSSRLDGTCEGMKITSSGDHKLNRWVTGNPELVPPLQTILEGTSSGIITQLPMDRTCMISNKKFKCCSYHLIAVHNVFKCVYDICPLSTWSTLQTLMVYTTQILLGLDEYFSFHFSRRKIKTEFLWLSSLCQRSLFENCEYSKAILLLWIK